MWMLTLNDQPLKEDVNFGIFKLTFYRATNSKNTMFSAEYLEELEEQVFAFTCIGTSVSSALEP